MKKILFLGHDANRAGAQLVLLQLLKQLKMQHLPIHLLLEEGGMLEDEFKEVVSISTVPKKTKRLYSKKIDAFLSLIGILKPLRRLSYRRKVTKFKQQLQSENFGLVFANTVATASMYKEIEFLNLPTLFFVHELGMSVKMYSQPDDLKHLLSKTNHLFAVSGAVASFYADNYQFPIDKISKVQIIDTQQLLDRIENSQDFNTNAILNLPQNAIVVGGCGHAEWRKGNDFFMLLAQSVIRRLPNQAIYFMWVGMSQASELYDIQRRDAEMMGLDDRIIHVEPTASSLNYINRFDVFALCSREDPYPLVVLEAALAKKPIVCFADAGGASELVEDDAGFIVPYFDLKAMSNKIAELIENPELRQKFGQIAKQKVLERHQTQQNVQHIVDVINKFVQP